MVGYSRYSSLGFGVDVGSLRYSLCLLVVLLLLPEESLVGTFCFKVFLLPHLL